VQAELGSYLFSVGSAAPTVFVRVFGPARQIGDVALHVRLRDSARTTRLRASWQQVN
jgi:hypothetical protein